MDSSRAEGSNGADLKNTTTVQLLYIADMYGTFCKLVPPRNAIWTLLFLDTHLGWLRERTVLDSYYNK